MTRAPCAARELADMQVPRFGHVIPKPYGGPFLILEGCSELADGGVHPANGAERRNPSGSQAKTAVSLRVRWSGYPVRPWAAA